MHPEDFSVGPTHLDAPHRFSQSSRMDDQRARCRRVSESRGHREHHSGYYSPERRGDGERQSPESNNRPYRYYERGHPLPSNYVPEPKACVPYRNVNLGVPSQRRNTDTYMLETWRSDSPERYTYHSNFRRGPQSQRNSPTRHSSLSPDRFRTAKPPVGSQRRVSLSRCQARSHASSRGSSQLPSYAPSPNASGRSSPARRRGSIASRAASPTRCTPSRRQLQKEHEAPRRSHRASRSESQLSNKHSLDSEKLYKNLESISRRGSTVISRNSFEGSKGSPPSRGRNTFSCNSGDMSPSRNCYSPNSQTPQGDLIDHRLSPSQRSWKGSAYSLLSPPPSHYSSTSRRGGETPLHVASLSPAAMTGSDKDPEWNTGPRVDRSGSNMRRGMDSLLISEPKKTTEDLEEVGMTIDDYVILADIPKIQLESEEELPGLRWRNQSPSPCRDQKLRTYRYQEELDTYRSRFESEERGRGRERGRDRREKYRESENGLWSGRESASSRHAPSSDNQGGTHGAARLEERGAPDQRQTQVNNVLSYRPRRVENGSQPLSPLYFSTLSTMRQFVST
ncbi:serine/arginine repetitive matrix protein 2-like isoform X2 [Takifugu flavidus]|nr:serine/arginine repetitive matrix protein 2-like isoform X2 [Takifugu flavidus]